MCRVPVIAPAKGFSGVFPALGWSAGLGETVTPEYPFNGPAGGRGWMTDSGISAFYLLLLALKETSSKEEVVLPAYTAGSLVTAVRKAGLRPVLCDISLRDFALDLDCLKNRLSPSTLCVVFCHLFGIGSPSVENIRELCPGVYIVEDCCQSMGALLAGKPVGGRGDAAFFSFNRGKNLPAGGGGAVFAAGKAADKLDKLFRGLPRCGPVDETKALVRLALFSALAYPALYGMVHKVAAAFRENSAPVDFPVRKISRPHLAVYKSVLPGFERLSRRRYENGMRLLNAPHGEGVQFPVIREQDRPAFNRFPLIIKEREKLEKARAMLESAGIESSRMYLRPLHVMFDLGYPAGSFPRAESAAEWLLTLPAHPMLGEKDLETMISILGRI